MGRKGIGKLAPFGICRQIEILSAGGERIDGKYQVSHFVMDYDEIIKDEPGAAPLTSGEFDRTWRETSGTKVTLRQFLPKRVPLRKCSSASLRACSAARLTSRCGTEPQGNVSSGHNPCRHSRSRLTSKHEFVWTIAPCRAETGNWR